MKILFTGILLLLTGISSFSQNSSVNVISLKNGSVIKGKILELVPGESIKIETQDKSTWVFKMDEIEKVGYEVGEKTDRSEKKEKAETDPSEYKTSGYVNYSELHFAAGIGFNRVFGQRIDNDGLILGFRTVNGYQFNRWISTGIGIGLSKITNGSGALLPLTLDVRTQFLPGKVSPTLNGNGGYAVGVGGLEGGWTFGGTAGVKVNISPSVAYLVSAGYTYYNIPYRFNNSPRYLPLSFISVFTGFSF